VHRLGLFSTGKKIVREETIGRWWISTLFVGTDINPSDDPDAPEWLWEAFAAGGNGERHNRHRDCCAGSKEQAEAMHEAMVKRVCAESSIRYRPARKLKLNEKTVRRLKEHLRKDIEAAVAQFSAWERDQRTTE
jgi:hypothetical protein